MVIREVGQADRAGIMRLWNRCVSAGEVLYFQMDDEYFVRKFRTGPGADAGVFIVAEDDKGQLQGAVHGVQPYAYPGAKPGWSYLTFELVAPEFRGSGIGMQLLAALADRMRTAGASTLAISSLNPVNIDWHIPGTPGHDHNNMPGLDEGCAGAAFFHRFFESAHREVAMYRSLDHTIRVPAEIVALRLKLQHEGIETGLYCGTPLYEFETLCRNVGSAYWQHVLTTEIQAHLTGQPNEDPALWPDGRCPDGPRPLLAAIADGRLVAFTGPIDRQVSGRGWFTGICTDPSYEHRGIATVLFSMLMEEFGKRGATFSTLFTGEDNRAQRIYTRAGMQIVRHFTLMKMDLSQPLSR